MSDYIINGPISSARIAEEIDIISKQHTVGGINFFLGQVRADQKEEQKVVSIEYSAYPEMANKVFAEIAEQAKSQFNLERIVLLHSVGVVKVGEVGLLVLVGAAHRVETMEGLRWTVEEIKARVPVFGKEMLADNTHQWKVNR